MDATHMPVQEILRGGVVPKDYIQFKDDNEVGNEPPPLMDTPTIDSSLLTSSNPEELAKLRSALSSWGCVQLVNHGISISMLDEVREMGKQFFELPLEEKKKYSSKGNGTDGYGNTNANQGGTLNWSDKICLQVYPEDKRQLQFWPENPQHFRTTILEFSKKNQVIVETLLKAMARSLNIEEERFLELWGDDTMDIAHARYNYYPPCPISDRVLGLNPHGDGTAITLLLQDKEVEGLQVIKDGCWYRVAVIPEALTIIVGDQMEMWSNGIFKSPIHKAVPNSDYERVSLVLLFLPSLDKEIGPLNELINEERPQLYKRFKDYSQFFPATAPTGKSVIDTLKIHQ